MSTTLLLLGESVVAAKIIKSLSTSMNALFLLVSSLPAPIEMCLQGVQVERVNRILKEATVKKYHHQSDEELTTPLVCKKLKGFTP